MAEDRLLNTRQIASILGVELNVIYDYIRFSGLPAFKIGGNGKSKRHYRVRESDFNAWLETQRVKVN